MFTKNLEVFNKPVPIRLNQANTLLEKANRALQVFMAEKSNRAWLPCII